MTALLARLRRISTSDGGFSIIEVLVAIIVFGIVATGIAYSLASTLNLTRDARSREVAIHLASQEIDKIRSLEDIFDVVYDSANTTVDGIEYTVVRDPVWDNSAGDAIQCGDLANGSGSFEFKRVQIAVTWAGQRPGSSAVYSDTIVSPNRRITDKDLGTVLVKVINAAGTGSAGISVSLVPDGGGATPPTEAIPVTDTEGCSYALKVTPGQYRVVVSKTGYVDVKQNLNESESTMTIAAGELKSVQFQFDDAATFSIDYAHNFAGTVSIPVGTPVTAASTYGVVNLTGSTLRLHPFSSGYELIAGKYEAVTQASNGCLSPDPSQWPEGSDGSIGLRAPAVTAAPGATVAAPVEMGVAQVSLSGSRFVQAVSLPTNSDSDDPGCADGYVVDFGELTSGTKNLALPFGSWQIQSRSGGSWSTLTTSGSSRINSILTTGQIYDGNDSDDIAVTFDPRKLP